MYPILLLIASGSLLGVLLGFLVAMPLVQAAMYGPLAAFTTEIFATGSRDTGAWLGYQLSSTLGGGFAPLIAVAWPPSADPPAMITGSVRKAARSGRFRTEPVIIDGWAAHTEPMITGT